MKEFATATLNPDDKIFIVYIQSFTSLDSIYLSYRAQIILLKTNKTSSVILIIYTNFIDIFSLILIIELLKHTRINDYIKKLLNNKQLFDRPIYNLGPVILKILKTYIEINLVKYFIKPSKSLVNISILFFGNLMVVFAYVLITKVLIL